MKTNIIYAILLIGFLSSCATSTNKNFHSSQIDIDIKSPMIADIDIDMSKKISGVSKFKKILFFTVESPEVFADGVEYSPVPMMQSSGGLFSFLFTDVTGGLKAAAAYNAVNSAKTDVIVAPQYTVKRDKGLFTEEINVQVTGYAGKVKGIRPNVTASSASMPVQ